MNTIADCIAFANANPLCFLATSIDEQPYVRALGFWFADETGFYFQTGSIKEFPAQLKKNPKTEVCFYKHDGYGGVTMRVAGSVDFVDSPQLREKALNDRPFLKNFGITINSPGLVLFRISHGKAHFWSMAVNMNPKEIIEF
jgi:uncharacterized pyridoxamine 5'-phosphate oxidase family protein